MRTEVTVQGLEIWWGWGECREQGLCLLHPDLSLVFIYKILGMKH